MTDSEIVQNLNRRVLKGGERAGDGNPGTQTGFHTRPHFVAGGLKCRLD